MIVPGNLNQLRAESFGEYVNALYIRDGGAIDLNTVTFELLKFSPQERATAMFSMADDKVPTFIFDAAVLVITDDFVSRKTTDPYALKLLEDLHTAEEFQTLKRKIFEPVRQRSASGIDLSDIEKYLAVPKNRDQFKEYPFEKIEPLMREFYAKSTIEQAKVIAVLDELNHPLLQLMLSLRPEGEDNKIETALDIVRQAKARFLFCGDAKLLGPLQKGLVKYFILHGLVYGKNTGDWLKVNCFAQRAPDQIPYLAIDVDYFNMPSEMLTISSK